MDQHESFFIRYRASIIIIIAAVFVALGVLLWLQAITQNSPTPFNQSKAITDKQVQVIINDTPKGPPMNQTQTNTTLKESPTGTGAMTKEQRNQILGDSPK